jgi:hypothetical protein
MNEFPETVSTGHPGAISMATSWTIAEGISPMLSYKIRQEVTNVGSREIAQTHLCELL